MSGSTRTLTGGKHRVELGNPDKELFGSGGVTKRELAEHYRAVAPWMLPHVRERPLALHRFPDGIDPGSSGTEGFFQKQRPEGAPEWVRGVRVPREQGGSTTMVVCDYTATLLWLADQAVVTPHPWLSRVGDLRRPDRIVVDLDPADGEFAPVRRAAHDVREVLEEVGLVCYVMTTGSRGLHVVAPIRPEQDVDEVRDLARGVADRTAERHSDRLTTRVRKDQRQGRLFLDILRNAYAQHSVAPYAVRPLPGAPVATPLSWQELDEVDSPQAWSVRTFADRLEEVERARGDPWAGMARHARSPRRAAERLARLAD